MPCAQAPVKDCERAEVIPRCISTEARRSLFSQRVYIDNVCSRYRAYRSSPLQPHMWKPNCLSSLVCGMIFVDVCGNSRNPDMNYSLNSLKGGCLGDITGFIQGDAWSLDYSSHVLVPWQAACLL